MIYYKHHILLIILLLLICSYRTIHEYYANSVGESGKVLILGSAPYVKEWVDNYLDWFVSNNYVIITFNNSWKLIQPIELINEYHCSADHADAGTFVMNEEEESKIKTIIHHNFENIYYELNHMYVVPEWGSMYFNTLYNLLVNYKKRYASNLSEIVVIGCDFVYKKDKDTFYSELPNNKARNDPLLLWGKEGMQKEINKSHDNCTQRNVRIYNASLQEETNLSYPRFTDYLYL